MEIERKWRLPKVPKVVSDNCAPARIIQGYVVINEQGEVRLRNDGSGFILTFKGSGEISRAEENYKLETEMGYKLLWPGIIGFAIVKDRYSFANAPFGVFEVDHYKEHLDGLVTMELEFPNLENAKAFVLPEWAAGAIDVTDDKRYKNKNLALNAQTIRAELQF
jgi:CYTH domain-containing protein